WVVDGGHDLARLPEVAVVRVVEVVAADDERQIVFEEHLVHLPEMPDRIARGVRARGLRLVRVVRVVPDESLTDGRRDGAALVGNRRLRIRLALPADDEGEVGRLGPSRPDVHTVAGGVA